MDHAESLSPQCQMSKNMARQELFSSSCYWFLTFENPGGTCFISPLLLSTGVTLHEILSPSEPHFCLWRNRGFASSSLRSLPPLIFWDSGILRIQEHYCFSQTSTPLALSWPLLTTPDRTKREEERQPVAAACWKNAWGLWNSDNSGNHTQGFVSYSTVQCGHQPRCELGDTLCSLLNDMQESQRDFIISFVRSRYELHPAVF